MKVLNIHSRNLDQPKERVATLFKSLTLPDDKFWPYEHWPKMRFKEGLKVGAKGGHGPIRYTLVRYAPNDLFEFSIDAPKGFDGIHKLELYETEKGKSCITHTIEMNTSGMGTLKWVFGIRSLHDALIEDAFDKLENQLNSGQKYTSWSLWVKVLRKVLK